MASILIVEDNEMNRDMLSRRLMRKGYLTLIAIDASSGLRTARDAQPDLILMDMSLPDMTGSQAALVLKTDRMTCRIPIIALTAHATEAARQEALAAGCVEFETKPIDLAALIAKMEIVLGRMPRLQASEAG
jgi:CheY-like chemotaxis protein